MTIFVDAVYEDGVLRLKSPIDLPERAQVRVRIDGPDEARTELGRRLLELRSEIVRSGTPTLNWDDIEAEVSARRGGWQEPR